jgi:hypothetical protein
MRSCSSEGSVAYRAAMVTMEPPRGIEPGPTHYDRVRCTTVADGWCGLSWAVPDRPVHVTVDHG